MKRYLTASLNLFFFNENILIDDKKSLSLRKIFCVKPNFYCLTCKNCLKPKVFPGFFSDFCSKFKAW